MERLSRTRSGIALTADVLLPFVGKFVMVHVIDGPKQIKNYDEVFVGVVKGFHLSSPSARRLSAGDGSITLDTYVVHFSKYQEITVTEVETTWISNPF